MKKYVIMSLSLMLLLLVGCSGASSSGNTSNGENKFSYCKSQVSIVEFFKNSEKEISELTPDEEAKRQKFYEESKMETKELSESEFNKFIKEAGITNQRLINILKVENTIMGNKLDEKIMNEKLPKASKGISDIVLRYETERNKIKNSNKNEEEKREANEKLKNEEWEETKALLKKYDNEISEIIVNSFPEDAKNLKNAQNIIKKLYPNIKLSSLGSTSNGIKKDINDLKKQVDTNTKRIEEVAKENRQGIALTTAMAQINPLGMNEGKFSAGVGMGYFKGETGLAFGVGYGISEGISLSSKGAFATSDFSTFAIGAGMNFEF